MNYPNNKSINIYNVDQDSKQDDSFDTTPKSKDKLDENQMDFSILTSQGRNTINGKKLNLSPCFADQLEEKQVFSQNGHSDMSKKKNENDQQKGSGSSGALNSQGLPVLKKQSYSSTLMDQKA
jgi:hypothetical protein